MGDLGVDIGLGCGNERDRNISQALLAILDVAERVHHLHPGGDIPENLPGPAIVLDVLTRPGFIREVKIGRLEHFFRR